MSSWSRRLRSQLVRCMACTFGYVLLIRWPSIATFSMPAHPTHLAGRLGTPALTNAEDSYKIIPLLAPSEVEATLKLAKSVSMVASVRLGPQMIWQMDLYRDGSWMPDTADFQELLRAPMDELQKQVSSLDWCLGEDVAISRFFLCRYLPKEGYATGLRNLAPHRDKTSFLSAACSLSAPITNSGFYIVPNAENLTERVYSNAPAGHFTIHRWNLLHGVSTQAQEERYSLVAWWKPRNCFASQIFFCPGATGDPQAALDRGQMALKEGETSVAEKWFRVGAREGDESCRLYLILALFRQGSQTQVEEALSLREAEDEAAILGFAKHLTDDFQIEEAKTLLQGMSSPHALNQLAVVFVRAKDYEGARALLTEAAQAGESSAMHNLVLFCERGIGGPVDEASAKHWRQTASELPSIS
eukprot:TRINITY_DN25777_c0_g1_i1.p1 TRINITY_DN25777_c0_g1~~TRINITY_DN25777_c0_g1_i1.p1  ORF type:complete len:415 (+),score=58.03 TRINITY_DN25777_c0_g1_i1:68-1312(+)